MNNKFKQYKNFLFTYLGPQKGRVIVLGLTILVSLGLQLVTPQLMRDFIDSVTQGTNLSNLVRLGVYFLVAALLQQAFAIITAYYTQNVAWTATNALREDLTGHSLNLDMSFHKAHPPGEMISRIDSDINTLNDFFSQFLLKLIGNMLLVIAILILLFREDWRIGLMQTAFTLVALLILIRFRNIGVPHWEKEREAEADFYGFLEERLGGTADIRANGGRAYTLRQFFARNRTMYQRSIKAGMMVNILLNSMSFTFAVGIAASLAVSGVLFLNGIISIGTVYIVYAYNGMLETPLRDISRQLSNVQKALASIKRIFQIQETESKIVSAEGPFFEIYESSPTPAIAFDHVCFRYDDSPNTGENGTVESSSNQNVLDDITFRLAPGEVMGLLGRTGSGKTTLTRLLFRLYDPQTGSIQFQSGEKAQNIRGFPLQHLRTQIGMVTQNIELFQASVRDNLTFFDPTIPDEQILQVIRELGLARWYDCLQNGLDSLLDSGGAGLSAGEAQLLAFTRIFLKDPKVVVLDEASSRLDPATEHLIEKAIDRLVQNRTALIIAHRLRTIQRADKIMILEKGQIVETGDRSILADDPKSRFHNLLKTGMEEVLV